MRNIIFLLVIFLTTSCGLKLSLLKGKESKNIVGGVVSPLVGSISYQESSSLFISSASAIACADPAYAKLFLVENDGSIDDNNPIASQLLNSEARYSFDMDTLGKKALLKNVQYLVKAEGCNGDIYKRPITGLDTKQDLNARTTIIAEVVNANSLITTTLNEAKREDVEKLINSMSGSNLTTALDSLQNENSPSSKFTEIFGASPTVIQDARPEVKLSSPTTNLNELATSTFRANSFHVDPNYSFVYSWKLDGVVKASTQTWNYTPSANDSGMHQIDVYVGKDNGSGSIDLTKPYYVKTFDVNVNNNIAPVAPAISLNTANLSPVNTNTIAVDIATGPALSNCSTFSRLAITDSSTSPSAMQFNINCSVSGTQTESVSFSSSDGTKTIYIWAIDNEGSVSNPKTLTVVLDTLPPVANLNFASTLIRGGTTQTITLSGSDAGTGLASLKLYYSATGSAPFTLLSNLSTTATSYSWSVPASNTTASKLQLIATDLTGSTTTATSGAFAIDSLAPTAPTISRTSASPNNSTTVIIGTTCSSDYDKILYSETSTTPLLNDSGWETCAATKNFTVSTANGTKTIYAFTKDAAGNLSTSSNITMSLDNTPPAAPILTLTSGAISSGTSITFTASDCTDRPALLVSESATTPSVSDSAWQTCTTSASGITHTLASAAQGSHNLYIFAKDAVGNISSSTSKSMIYDTVNPTLSMSTTLDSLYKGGDVVALNFSSSDTNGLSLLKIEYAADGSTYTLVSNLATSATTYNWTVPASNTSAAKIRLVATDNAVTANSTTVASATFTVDSTAPTAPTISRTSATPTNSTIVTIGTTCSSDYDKILYTETSTTPALADSAWENCAATKNFLVSAANGTKTIYAFTKDAAGNISTSSNVTLTLDDVPPATPVLALTSSAISSSTNLTFTAADCIDRPALFVSESNVAPSASDSDWQTCVTSASGITHILTSSTQGTHNLYIFAKDTAGNISLPATKSMIYDTTNPTLSMSTTLASLYKGGDVVALNFSSSDTNGLSSLKLEYAADGSTYTTVVSLATSATTYNWTVPASNTTTAKIRLVAVDNAVTANSTTVTSGTFTVDSTAPTAPTIARTSATPSNSTTVAIAATCSSDYDKILYSETSTTPALGDSGWENCAATKNFVVTSANGTKTIYAFTKDTAGNISASSNVTMTLDDVPPAEPVLALTSNAISSSTGITLTAVDCLDRPALLVSESIIAPSVSDSAWQTCVTTTSAITYILTGPALQGVHNLYIYAKDTAGNISLPAMKSMIYDTTNPTLSLSTTIASLYKGSDVIALSFSASDANGLSSLKLEYAADGSTYTLAANLATSATTYNWTVPASNTVNAKIRLIAVDNSITANSTTVTSGAFTVDSIAPSAPGLTRTSLANTSSAAVTMTVGSCTDTATILINETATTPSGADAGWTTCSTAASAFTRTVTGQGNHTIYAWAKDLAGNISTSSNITMNFDSIAPAINSGPTVASALIGGSSQAITWNVTDANTSTIKLEFFNGSTWANIQTALSNTGTYTWTVPSLDIATAKLRLTATDLAGNTSTNTSADIIIDSTPPAVDTLALNSGASTTNNNNVQISLTAHDALSKIKFFCLRYDDTTKPTAADACWKDVTAPIPGIAYATSISFSNYFFQVGFTKATKVVYAWVKDESGQISNNTATAATDKASIYFDPGTPPVLAALQATNSDTPNNPPTGADLSAPTTGYIYIKWNASDLEGLAANPITINYTTNDTTYNSITGGTDIANAANGSCTVDAGFTGCAKLPSPSNGYYKIRVIAKDTLGTTVFLNSAPLNDLKVRLLAGNTEDGLNGSALSAIFNMYGKSSAVSYTYKNKLVVSDDGKIFYLDKLRGLLWIDPNNGVLKKFIPTTGASSGDGGAVASATLNAPSAIALDFKNNLLIWDNDRIRKVNLSAMTISTLLGGGTNTDPSTTVASTAIKLSIFNAVRNTFLPLPNGDIIFSSPDASLHERRFRASDNQVELIDLQGQGFYNYSTDSWTTTAKTDLGIDFNPTTSAINFMMKGFTKVFSGDSYTLYSRVDHTVGNETTPYPGIGPYDLNLPTSNVISGMDGKIYLVDRFRYIVRRYNVDTNTRTNVLGNGIAGTIPCADGTLSSSCKVDIDTLFVAKNGRMYFVDNGIIRTVDDANKVVTLAGQFPSYGSGSLATVARFGNIQDIQSGKTTPTNNKIIVQDIYSDEFREFTINSTISSLATVNYNYNGPFRFETDKSTGDIIAATNAALAIRKFTRSNSTWSTLVGGGANLYRDATASDGKIGSTINFESSYPGSIIGFINNVVYYHKFSWQTGGSLGCQIKGYDAADSYRQSSFMGHATSCAGGVIPVGGVTKDNILTTTNITNIEYFQDPTDSTSKFFFGQIAAKNIYTTTSANGTNSLFATFANATSAFTHNFDVNGLNFFYCGSNGLLYKHIYSTNTTVPLTWLSPTFKCKGAARTIIYNSDRNSVIFPFTQNGLDGVAEYDLN